MDDTTHPCFYSRCMVWSLLVEWYIIIFSDVNIRESKPNSGEKAVRSPSRSRQGCGMMVWQDGRWDGHFGWKCHGGVYWVKSQQQMTYTRCNKQCIMEKQFWSDLKRWGLEERTTSQSFCCVSIAVLCVLFVYHSLSFCPSDKKSQQKICQARRCPPLWIWQPLLWVLAFSRYLMLLGGVWHLSHQACTCRNWKSPQKIKVFFCESSQKGSQFLRDFFWWFISSFSFFAPFFWGGWW